MQSSLKHHFLTSLKRGLLNVLKFLSTFKVMVVIEGTVAFFALYLFLSLSNIIYCLWPLLNTCMVELVSSPFNILLFISYIIKYVYTNRPHSVGKGWAWIFYVSSFFLFWEREGEKEREIVMILITVSHFPDQYQSCWINDVC